MSSTKPDNRVLTYGQAMLEGTRQEMARDPGVFVLGLGVDDAKGMYGTTSDLHKEFGADRCFDTPLAEDAMTGIAIGAAMAGMRPIHIHQRMDFLLLCMNQLINMAAKQSYMFSGAVSVPLVVRGIIGRSWGQGAQHSQAFHSFFMHVPGLKVLAPTTPYDAKGALIAAIRDPNPVIMMEHRMLYNFTGIVPEEAYEVPFGKARVLTRGKDITIVGVSYMVAEALRAKHLLEEVGIEAEVIDPVSLAPLDIDTIVQSVQRTGRLLVVDTSWLNCGFSAEVLSETMERLSGKKSFQAKRVGYAPTPCPTTKPLERVFYPNAQSIALAAHAMVKGEGKAWKIEHAEPKEIAEFKGPF